MSLAHPVHRLSIEQYYEKEHRAEHKSDFYNGEIFAMAGGTARHSRITTNIGGELHRRLKGNRCEFFESNLRIKVIANGLRTYPDGTVFCDKLERDADDPYRETYTNPTIVFEVISKSTEAYDRGFKAQSYRRIESLKAYVLISQNTLFIEIHERQDDGRWAIREVEGLDGVLVLPAIGVEVPLRDVYDRVDFSATDEDEANPSH